MSGKNDHDEHDHHDDEHDHEHDHGHHPEPPSDVEARALALESLLIEKGILTSEQVDGIIRRFEQDIGPMLGARVVARAWVDPDFRRRLIEDANAAVGELGLNTTNLARLSVVANEPGVHNMIVCTLCSCYPWMVLGLPPTWYKSPPYRSRAVREPRVVLGEFGVRIGEDVEIRVWDSSSDLRYMVLPERPPGTQDMTEAGLAELVTRDSMIGVGLPRVAATRA
jgi:nitrile hydratase